MIFGQCYVWTLLNNSPPKNVLVKWGQLGKDCGNLQSQVEAQSPTPKSAAVVIYWAAKSHKMSLTTPFHSYQSVTYFHSTTLSPVSHSLSSLESQLFIICLCTMERGRGQMCVGFFGVVGCVCGGGGVNIFLIWETYFSVLKVLHKQSF